MVVIAIPIVLLVLFVVGGYLALVRCGLDDWREVWEFTAHFVGALVPILLATAAICGLVAWIEAWS